MMEATLLVRAQTLKQRGTLRLNVENDSWVT